MTFLCVSQNSNILNPVILIWMDINGTPYINIEAKSTGD